MKKRLTAWFTLVRPFAVPWVVSNFLLGAVYGGLSHDIIPLLLAILGMTLILFASHAFNAYWDFVVTKLDRSEKGSKKKAYTAASLVLPSGRAEPMGVLVGSLILWFTGSLTYIYLAWDRPLILIPLGLGLFSGIGYSVFFKTKGFGEISLFLGHGISTTTAGYIATTGSLKIETLLVSVIMGLWAALAYGVDQWKDIESDLIRRVRTVAARLDGYNMRLSNYLQLYYFMILLYHMALIIGGILPPGTLISMLTFAPIFATIVVIDRDHDKGSLLVLTSMILYPLLMTLGLLI